MYMFSEKWNTYLTSESPNQFYINYLNPFHPAYRMAITITYPLLPYISNEDDKNKHRPEVNAGDILALFPNYRELLEQNGDVMVMLSFLIDLSQEIANYELLEKNNEMYRYLVVLHTAHNLSLHIREIKDEANLVSLNNEVVEKNFYMNDITKLLEKGEDDSFNLTLWGRKFKEIYYPLVAAHLKNNFNRSKNRRFKGWR